MQLGRDQWNRFYLLADDGSSLTFGPTEPGRRKDAVAEFNRVRAKRPTAVLVPGCAQVNAPRGPGDDAPSEELEHDDTDEVPASWPMGTEPSLFVDRRSRDVIEDVEHGTLTEAQLDALQAAELEGRNRTTVLDAIRHARH